MGTFYLHLGLVFIMSVGLEMVEGSGRLNVPVSRASWWRTHSYYPCERNEKDDQVNCGGADNQWNKNDGRCGVCGDPWDDATPRDHEGGGLYICPFIIGKTRYQEGDVLTADITLTDNKMGWFEFRVCPQNDYLNPTTQECLDKYLLKLEGTDDTRYWVKKRSEKSSSREIVYLQLPVGLYCPVQCVFQWKYQTGTNTDDCSDCKGKEQFYACADILITPRPTTTTTSTTEATTTSTEPTTTLTEPTTTGPTTTEPTTTEPITTTAEPTTTTTEPTTTTTEPTTTTTEPTTTTTKPTTTTKKPTTTTIKPTTTTTASGGKKCEATEEWKDAPGRDMTMDEWCALNCRKGHCPPNMCVCTDSTTPPQDMTCKPTKPWEDVDDMQEWCRVNCAMGHCPEDWCYCPGRTPDAKPTVTPTKSPVTGNDILCIPKKEWRRDPSVWRFCWQECGYLFCVKSICDCRIMGTQQQQISSMKKNRPPNTSSTLSKLLRREKCVATGSWSHDQVLQNWCQINCGIYGVCPKEYCKC